MSDTKPQEKARRKLPHHYYKLSERDHKVIAEGLYKFVPVYVLAKKIGCNYHTLLNYIKRHPELDQIGKDAEANMVAFAKGKLMQKVGAGHAASIMFLLERLDREHFGRYATIESIGDLPAINIGVFEEKDFIEPTDPATVGATAEEILAKGAEMAASVAKREEEELEAAEAETSDEAEAERAEAIERGEFEPDDGGADAE